MNTVLMVILGIVSLVIIISVMLQESSGDGAAALGGSNGTAAKKAKGYEALLSKLTIAGAIIFVILTIVLLILE